MRIKSWITPLNRLIENHEISHFVRNDSSHSVVEVVEGRLRRPSTTPFLLKAASHFEQSEKSVDKILFQPLIRIA